MTVPAAADKPFIPTRTMAGRKVTEKDGVLQIEVGVGERPDQVFMDALRLWVETRMPVQIIHNMIITIDKNPEVNITQSNINDYLPIPEKGGDARPQSSNPGPDPDTDGYEYC